MTSKLLPCPFCGSAVELEQTESFYNAEFGVRKWWGVVCRSTTNRGGTCAIQTRPAASEEAAVARWNKRAPLSPDHSEPVAYMRNEGTPNNLVKCSFADQGAFGVYRGPVSRSALPDHSGGAGEVVFPERREPKHYWDRFGKMTAIARVSSEEWNACLDKVKELNQ